MDRKAANDFMINDPKFLLKIMRRVTATRLFHRLTVR